MPDALAKTMGGFALGWSGVSKLVAPTVIATLLLAGCASTSGPVVTSPIIEATVVAVFDGDSILVEDREGQREVRLDGVNAPETEECFHREATDYLVANLEGRQVSLEVTGIDQFGRTLAHVHQGDTYVNFDLVSRGLAIATTPRNGGLATLVEAEEAAAASGRGLWGPESCGVGPIPLIVIDFDRSVVNPPGPDHQVLDQEIVVLANPGNTEVDLTGWTLRDESSRHRFRFAEGTKLGSGERLTVTSADPGWSPGDSPVWNNDGDLILVLDQAGRVVARFRY